MGDEQNQEISLTYTANISDAESKLDKLISKLERIQQLADKNKLNIGGSSSTGNATASIERAEANARKARQKDLETVFGSTEQKSFEQALKAEESALSESLKRQETMQRDARSAFASKAFTPSDLSSTFNSQEQSSYEQALKAEEKALAESLATRQRMMKDAYAAFTDNEQAYGQMVAKVEQEVAEYSRQQFAERQRQQEMMARRNDARSAFATQIPQGAQTGYHTQALSTQSNGQSITGIDVDMSGFVDRLKMLLGVVMVVPMGLKLLWQGIQKVGDVAKTAGGSISNGLGKALNVAWQGVQRLVSMLPKLASAAGTALKGVANLAKTGIQRLGERAKNATHGLTTMVAALKRVAIYRIIRGIIKSISDGFREGTENAYRWAQINNNQLAPSLDSIATEGLYLKNSVGAMAAPLINMLAPAIATVVDWVVTLINALNRLFAMLGGQGTWIKATKQADKYKDAVGGASKAVKSFTIGIDELNILEDKASGGGGGADADYGGMFEEVALGSSALRDAINNGEWMQVGTLIAEKINDSIAGIDAMALGLKIGGKIENAIEFSYGFLKNINTQQIGDKVATFLNNGLKAIDTNLLGKTIGEKWNRVVDLVYGFVDEFSFDQLATKITDYFRGAFEAFDVAKLADTVSKAVHGIFTFVSTFIETFPTTETASAFANFINTIDFANLISSTGQAITGLTSLLFDIISHSIQKIEWGGVGKGLVDGLVNAISSQNTANLTSSIFELLGSAVGGGLDLIGGIIQGIADAWQRFWEEIFAPYIDENGRMTIEGFFNGIWDAIKDVGTWINENIFQPFIKGFKEAFGIASPSTVMAEQGGYIIAGLWEGIKNAWHSIPEYFKTVLDELKGTINTKWTTIKVNATEKWEEIKGKLVEKWEETKSRAAEVWEQIKTEVNTRWDFLKNAAQETAETIASKFEGIVNRLDTVANEIKDIMRSIGDAISDAWEDAKDFVNNAKQSIGEANVEIRTGYGKDSYIQGRATGGFMETGQIYTVREGGIPEYVGSYGSRAAVANNDQIVEGISSGVAVANGEVVEAINTLIGVVAGLDLSVNIGDKDIGQANERYANSRGVYVNRGAFVGTY